MRRSVAVAALSMILPSFAVASTWSPMTAISYQYGPDTDAGAPDIVISPVAGRPYVAFENTWAGGNDRIIDFARGVPTGRSVDWSGTLNNPVEVCPRGTKPGAPSIAAGSRNGQEIIHIVYWDHLGTEDVMYVRSTDGGNTWSVPVNISNSQAINPGAALAADDQGNVYVIWADWVGNANGNNVDIWFRKGTYNGSTTAWAAPYKIENNPNTKSEKPRVFRDLAGKLHVVWTDRVALPRKVSYAVSVNNGASFTSPETVFVVPDTQDVKPAAVAVAGDGTIYVSAHVVEFAQCCEPSDILLSTKVPGGTWTAPVGLTGNPATNPWLTADNAGHIFMSYLRLPNDGNGDIYVMFHNNFGWSCAGNATRDAQWKGYDGGHMALDAVNGFIHVATDDTHEGRTSPHRVWVTTLDLLQSPLPAANLTAHRGDAQATLSWKNPDEPDLGAIRIVYRTDHYPTSPTDGTIAPERAAVCGQSDTFTITGLPIFSTCYCAVYARDDYGNFASPALASTIVAPRIVGDFDDDFDVDQSDFGHFQACYSGPSIPQYDSNCQDAKLDGDSDVDQYDFAVFQACMSGTNVMVTNPACMK